MLRQIVLDTETTGIGPQKGHRVIEIGCVEIVDRKLAKNTYHQYINPQRDIDEEALKVHGLSQEFLADKPTFADIANDFLAFVRGAELIIHNAPFDVGFLNHEFKLLNAQSQSLDHWCRITDSLTLARKKHPGQKNNLDALCKRYAIDRSHRELHGALLDAEILAHVYLAMTGGQIKLAFDEQLSEKKQDAVTGDVAKARVSGRVIKASAEELVLHQARIKQLAERSQVNLWADIDDA